jgi:hypothetical protein
MPLRLNAGANIHGSGIFFATYPAAIVWLNCDRLESQLESIRSHMHVDHFQ